MTTVNIDDSHTNDKYVVDDGDNRVDVVAAAAAADDDDDDDAEIRDPSLQRSLNVDYTHHVTGNYMNMSKCHG